MRTFAVALVLSLTACKKTPQKPEQQVEAAVNAMEAAVEAKDLGAIKGMMVAGYKDARGMKKKDVVGMLQLQFLRRKSIHLLVRIQDLVVQTPTLAKTQLLVAAGATQMADVSALEKVKADMLRIDVTWTKEDDTWRVQRSSWRRAGLTDFVD